MGLSSGYPLVSMTTHVNLCPSFPVLWGFSQFGVSLKLIWSSVVNTVQSKAYLGAQWPWGSQLPILALLQEDLHMSHAWKQADY